MIKSTKNLKESMKNKNITHMEIIKNVTNQNFKQKNSKMKLNNLNKHPSRILKKLKDTKPDRNKIELAISKTESIGLIE